MEFVERVDDRPEPISIASCRELLGEEAESMTDQEVATDPPTRRDDGMRRGGDVPRRLPDYRVELVPRKRHLSELANGSTLPAMVGAVIYVRVSTKEQTENLSLSTQLKACEEYCERQGFEVLARFREKGESAKTVVLPHPHGQGAVFEEYATGRCTKEQLLKQARAWGLTNRRAVCSHRKRSAYCCGISSMPASWTSPSTASARSVVTSSH